MVKCLKNRQGYTLVELMAALMIIGILAAIFVHISSRVLGKAKETEYLLEARHVSMAMESYILELYGENGEVTFSDLYSMVGCDINSLNHPLQEYIQHRCTPEAAISGIIFDFSSQEYNGLVYRVEDYVIILERGEAPSIRKTRR